MHYYSETVKQLAVWLLVPITAKGEPPYSNNPKGYGTLNRKPVTPCPGGLWWCTSVVNCAGGCPCTLNRRGQHTPPAMGSWVALFL